MAERSLEMIVGIMGILKAGGAYLPIDLTHPEDRIGYMLEDSKTMILLTQGYLLDNVNFQGEVLNLLDDSTYSESKENLENINTSKDLAYIIYTSGSTGRPKGVMIEHKGIVNLIQWIKYRYIINGESRILQSTTYTFDVSVEQIFAAILNGAKLYLISKEDFINSSKFTDFMIKNKITFAQFVPSTLQALIRDNVKFDNLEILTCGGDKLDKQLKKDILTKGYNLFNHYGPTEITVDAITTKCHGNDGNIIGKAINNTKIYIVNKDMNLMPIGVIGEICISGEGLASDTLIIMN
jgi:amino acid adenylation domain-containing protein